MKALVLGFHMLYRLSQDSSSKYPWSGPAVEIPRRPVTEWWNGSNSWAALCGAHPARLPYVTQTLVAGG